MMLFILVAVGLVAMLYTHNNVIGLRVSSHPSQSVFVGEKAHFPVTLHNDSKKDRSAVWLICAGFHQLTKLLPKAQHQVCIELPTIQRGYLVCDPIILSSQFPIGIFFVWTKRFFSDERCLVYPQPIDLTPHQSTTPISGTQEDTQVAQKGSEDYAGLKDYGDGDRLRDIHWPSLAKTNKLIAKEYESEGQNPMNFSWFSLPQTMDTEDRLSQLCYWVISAHEQGVKYQLEMPNYTIEYNQGNAHYHECLRTLALWGQHD